jgi:Sec-independent protein secretion pathway component TatC
MYSWLRLCLSAGGPVNGAILLIFIVAAFLTPSTDPWNQAIFAAPMIVLYRISALIVWAVQP